MAPFALALGRNVMDEMRDDEADQRFEDDRRDGEDAGLLDDQPESFASEQELEISKADELLHRLVQRGQMQRIEGRIDHEDGDQQDQGQRHEESRGRFPPQRVAQARASARARSGDAGLLNDHISHDPLSLQNRSHRSRRGRLQVVET
jgi:hypothetical protein